jgi:hypothetical protein
MLTFSRMSPWPRRWLLWAAVGLALRLLLIWLPRPFDDDTTDYLQLGHNLFHHGIYGMDGGPSDSPNLFRLPAYPIILATFEQLFAGLWPRSWFNAVFLFQALVDVTGCLLLASFVKRHLSSRAAQFALPLAMLCPFTAVFTGIGLTESLSVFAIATGFYAAGRALAAEQDGNRDLWALAGAGCAAGFAVMLRPDGALLCVALAAGLFYYSLRPRSSAPAGPTPTGKPALRRAFAAAAIYSLVALVPIAIWTARNWIDFQVFQPLAPRYLNDPGENYNAGFYRWMRTWAVEYVSTGNVYWNVGSRSIDIGDLPSRAFDSSAERALTTTLLDDYNRTNTISPQLDARFAALAIERIRANPLRYYVIVPLMRIADMLLRPRTWSFGLDNFWWHWPDHPRESLYAVLLGLLNLVYVGLAAWAFLRRQVPFAFMLGGYFLLRCLLLGTLENSEPRYTLECFPVLIVASAAALARLPLPASVPFRSRVWAAFHHQHPGPVS